MYGELKDNGVACMIDGSVINVYTIAAETYEACSNDDGINECGGLYYCVRIDDRDTEYCARCQYNEDKPWLQRGCQDCLTYMTEDECTKHKCSGVRECHPSEVDYAYGNVAYVGGPVIPIPELDIPDIVSDT